MNFFKKNIKKSDEVITQEKAMIKGVTELSETTVKEVMVPRIDVHFLPSNILYDNLILEINKNSYSRYPVYNETIDNVIGVLHVKDLFRLTNKNGLYDMKNIIRTPFFIPESKKLDSLLADFKRKKTHIAIVVDEYGGVSGIICMEDIIEEIIGDIQDEFDNEVDDITQLEDNIYLCDSRVSINDLNEFFDTDIPEDDFETLGGFAFNAFGKVPVKYEKISYGDYDFIINDMDGYKIKNFKIIKRGK